MSTQSTLTVTGFVGSSVRFSIGKESGVPFASFRLGSTRRIFDRATQAYRDGETQWYTVKVWRQVATNVVQSLRKGDPVVVTGRVHTEEWSGPEGPRSSLVIEATALGHDLVFGTTKLERTVASGSRAAGAAGAEGADEAGGADGAAPVDVTGMTVLTPDDDPGRGEPDEDELDEDDLDDALDEELDDEVAALAR